MIYSCGQENRRELVLQQAGLNGIDYLEVLGSPGCGTQLAVTFVKDATFAAEVDAFHTSHPIVGRQRTVEQALERMRYGVVFADALRRQF